MTKILFNDETIEKLIGKEAAEDEDAERLKQYYFKTSVYNSIRENLPLRILVAHKGMGKSALFKICHLEDKAAGELAIWIRPDDLYSSTFPETDDINALILHWKQALRNIIARKVIEFFGSEPDESITARLRMSGMNLVGMLADYFSKDNKSIVDQSLKGVLSSFLGRRRIFVYIDDLDRGWSGKPIDIKRVSALLNTLRDLSTDHGKGLMFRVGLRGDVYFLVRTSDESTDKFEQSVVWYDWTNHEIFRVLIKRVTSYFGDDVSDQTLSRLSQKQMATYLDRIMEPTFFGAGHWKNAPMRQVMLSLVRKRPRDLIKLCSSAARECFRRGGDRISSRDLEGVFEEYSQGRLQDAFNEYKSELSNIENLLLGMKPAKKERKASEGYVYTTDALLKKISNIMQSNSFKLNNVAFTDAKSLAQFMYKICFITARKELPNGHINRKYFDDNQYLSSRFADFGFDWEVHPAYRWALQPDTIQDVFDGVKLSAIDD